MLGRLSFWSDAIMSDRVLPPYTMDVFGVCLDWEKTNQRQISNSGARSETHCVGKDVEVEWTYWPRTKGLARSTTSIHIGSAMPVSDVYQFLTVSFYDWVTGVQRADQEAGYGEVKRP